MSHSLKELLDAIGLNILLLDWLHHLENVAQLVIIHLLHLNLYLFQTQVELDFKLKDTSHLLLQIWVKALFLTNTYRLLLLSGLTSKHAIIAWEDHLNKIGVVQVTFESTVKEFHHVVAVKS